MSKCLNDQCTAQNLDYVSGCQFIHKNNLKTCKLYKPLIVEKDDGSKVPCSDGLYNVGGRKMKKIIVIGDCTSCPFVGECKPWEKLTGKQKFQLTCAADVGKFILKGCPLPDGDEKLEAFEGI